MEKSRRSKFRAGEFLSWSFGVCCAYRRLKLPEVRGCKQILDNEEFGLTWKFSANGQTVRKPIK